MQLRHTALSLFLVFLSTILFSGCSLQFPWQKSVSGLQIQITDGAAAQVFLDDLHLGQTPITEDGLKPGVYTLRIEPEANDKQTYETQIRLHPGSITSTLWSFAGNLPTGSGDILELEPLPSNSRAELSVITVPEGATILLNDTTYGLSPVILDDIAPGQYSLTINAVGHVKKTLPVQIEPGYRLHVFSRLENDSLSKSAPAPTSLTDEKSDSNTLNTTVDSISESDAITQTAPTPTPILNTAGTTRATPTPVGQTTLPAKPYVTITETGTGWLRVRSEASSAGDEVARLDVGAHYPYKSTLNGWYEIEYETGKNGWISGQYANIIR